MQTSLGICFSVKTIQAAITNYISPINQPKPNHDMTIQNKQAMIESARMAIAYEFKSRHSFKGGRYSPRENVRDAVIFVRKMERGVA
jgi:hypothetical protein